MRSRQAGEVGVGQFVDVDAEVFRLEAGQIRIAREAVGNGVKLSRNAVYSDGESLGSLQGYQLSEDSDVGSYPRGEGVEVGDDAGVVAVDEYPKRSVARRVTEDEADADKDGIHFVDAYVVWWPRGWTIRLSMAVEKAKTPLGKEAAQSGEAGVSVQSEVLLSGLPAVEIQQACSR